MNTIDMQKSAANYMGALAHAFSGQAGRHAEFAEKVDLILSGAEPHAFLLMQFWNQVQQTGRPVIWVRHTADAPGVPQIGLVARDLDKIHIVENCMLWTAVGRNRLQLVPDNFKMGAFRFDEGLRLRHTKRAPAKDFGAATAGMSRAYERLLELERRQRERGDVFELPTCEPLRRAA